jgi:hypothetical protein
VSRRAQSPVDDIEFLAPRDFAFGGEDTAGFSGVDIDDPIDDEDSTPRPRWLSAAAGVVLAGMVGAGIVAAAPWDSPTGTSAPAPSTIVPPERRQEPARAAPAAGPSTVPARPLSVDARAAGAAVTGMVFDPLPPGYAITAAWNQAGDGSGEPIPGWGEVWATPDATRSSGRWFSLTLFNVPFTNHAAYATRIDLGRRVGLLEQKPDAVMRLTAPIGGIVNAQSLSITSFGLSTDELIALFTSIGIDADRPQQVDDRPRILDGSLLDGFDLVASRSTDRDLLDSFLFGRSDSTTYYTSGTGDQVIAVATAPYDAALEPLGRLAIGPIRIFPDTLSVPATFTGDDLVLGVSPSSSSPEIVARWRTDDATSVVVRTTMPLGELLELLPTLRPTTEDEWQVVKRRADGQQDVTTTAFPDDAGIVIGGGTLTSGLAWTVDLQPPGWATLRSNQDAMWFALSDHEPISTWSGGSMTVVAALVPFKAAEVMRIIVGGEVLVEVILTDLGPAHPTSSFDGKAAAYAFEQTGPFVVELLNADGAVVTSFRSPGGRP